MPNIGTPREERTAGTQPPREAPGAPAALPPARLRRVILVLAVACGMAVANIYYSQPLLGLISSAFGVSQGRTELVVTLTQLGYAVGLFLLVLLTKMLPKRAPAHPSPYPRLMASTLRLVREEPVLRRRAVCQALMFGAFSCFWTSVAFELIQRHHLGQAWIGIFALIGAAGAAAAPLAGRLGDLGRGHAGSGIALALGGA